METRKKIGCVVAPIVILVVAVLAVIDLLSPVTLSEELEFWNVWPKEGTEYISETVPINGKNYFVYSAVSEGTGLNGKDEYIILTGKVGGINNNSYNIFSYSGQDDKIIGATEYLNVYDFPHDEIKKGKNYFGSVYVGTVPITCTSVEIQGVQATMAKQSFTLNGQDVSFYLYYCIIEEPEYPDNATVIVTDMDGSKYSVYNADGGEYPILTKIE